MKLLQIKISTKESGKQTNIIPHNVIKETKKTFKTDLGNSISKDKIMSDWHRVLVDEDNGEVVIFSSIFCLPEDKDKAINLLTLKTLCFLHKMQKSIIQLSSKHF